MNPVNKNKTMSAFSFLKSAIPRYLPFAVLLLLSLNPIVWFWGRGKVLLDGVDINFPLNPLAWFVRRLFVWNSIANAGSDFSSSTAGLFFHLVQVVPYTLGLGLQSTQITSLIFWFILIIFSSYIFAKTILPGKRIFQILFIALYSYNIYLFNSWENIKVANLSTIAAIPLSLSIFVLLKDGSLSKKKAAFYSFLTGVVLSGSGINPSYIILFFVVFLIFAFGGLISELNIKSFFNVLKNFSFVTLFIILANLFWLIPTVDYIAKNVSPAGSIDKIGFTNWVQSLSENTSLLNVMRLQGAWDWYAVDGLTGLPLYIPYALNYFYRYHFIVFSFILTGLVIASLFVRKKKQNSLYVSFSLMFLLGVFLGVGTHPPTGYLFFFISRHIPFFTLFRSPWYIFTPLVTLSLAALIGLFFYNFEEYFFAKKMKFVKSVVQLLALILIMGNLFYSYPLITGKIFRYARYDSFFISFPDYVFDAQSWLVKANLGGRVIVYPDDEIENFDWGYRGIDSILSLLSDSEVLFSPLNAPNSPVAELIKESYINLKKNQAQAFQKIASKLNIGYLFEKRDQKSLSPELPDFIRTLPKMSFEKWNFYETSRDFYTPKIYSVKRAYFGEPYKEGHKVLGILESDEALLNPDDTVINKISGVTTIAGRIISSESSQLRNLSKFTFSPSILSDRLIIRDPNKVEFELNLADQGSYYPIIERYRLEDFGITLTDGLDLSIDGAAVRWEIERLTDSYVYFKRTSFSKGIHKISILLNNKNLVTGGSFEEDPLFEEFGRGKFEIQEGQDGRVLGILNIGEGAPEPSANFKISAFDPMTPYLIQLKYRQIYGNNASVIVLQGNANTLLKAQTERLPNYPDWNSFSFFYEPVKSESEAKIALVAPFTADPLGTRVFYDDLSVYKIFSNRMIFVKSESVKDLVTPKIEFKKVSSVEYEGKVEEARGPHLLVFSENYSPDWQMSIYDEGGGKLNIKPQHFSVNTYANSWYIEGALEGYKFKIYNKHQNLFWLGLAITLSIVLFFFLSYTRRRLNGKR